MNRIAWVLIPAVALAWAASASAQKPEKPDPETAIGCMRSINTAEVTYDMTYHKGYSPTLAALRVSGKGERPTAAAAGLLNDALSSGRMAGYVFVYKSGAPDKDGRINTYTVVARPEKWQKGLLSIFTDQTGKIRGTRGNREPTAQDELL
ncbi:MAG TPA: hypothetical protein VEG63_04490 [Candidatus Acidoferrales bacterium]|nr:hypothetical protein [Candidatus Acidoferrales bacterium]